MVHAFPQFDLDEERFELRREGRTVRVEPRVLEVLVYLARNRGRVVTKDELLEAVWKKTFVSESALTRCIMEARRAIGDPEREAPLIRTVHGRGYRFDAEELTDPPASSVVEIEAIPQAVPPAGVVIAAAPRRAAVRQIAAVVALAVMAVAGWAWVSHTTKAEPAPAAAIRLALLPISIDRDDRELQMAGMSIADLLEQRFTKTGRVRVRGADYSRPISVSAPNLVELAKRADADYIISGSMSAGSDPEGARLTLLMHEIRADGSVRDTPLGAFQLPLLRSANDIAHYAKLRERVVSRVVETVLPAFDPGPAGPFTPRSPESYRLYLLARERLASGGCDGEAAIELLRRSLEIDDRFAPAWDAYAWSLYRLSSSCTEGSRHHETLLAAAERALHLAPYLGSTLNLKARVLTETGRIEAAHALVRDGLAHDPANIELHRAQAMILAQAGFRAEARTHLQRAASADASALIELGSAAASNHDLRDPASLPASAAPRARYARGFAELMLGDVEAAHATLEPAFRSNPADAHARLAHALLAIIEDRPLEARAIVRHFARQRALVGEADADLTYRLAQLASLSGDHALALRQLERAVREGFFSVDGIDRDPSLAAIRGTGEYARIRKMAAGRRAAFGRRFGLGAR